MAYFVYKNRNNAVIRVFEAPAPFLTAGWQLQDDQNTDEIVAAIAAYENAKAAAGDGGTGGTGGGTTTPPPPTVDLASRADRTLSNLTDVPAARDALGLKGAALVEVGQHGGVASFDDPRLGDLVRTATTLLLFNSALVAGTAFTSAAFDRTTDPVAFDSTDLRATSDAPFTAVLQESADLTAWTTTHTYSVTSTFGVYATDEADLATTQRYSRLVLSATNGSMTKLFAEVDLVSGGGSNAATLAAARDRSTHTGTQLASTISDFGTAARAARPHNLVNGRPIVATRLGVAAASVQAGQNNPLQCRIKHVTSVACSGIRLMYGAPYAAELDGALQPVIVKVGLEYAGVVYPVTWGGKQSVTWEPGTPGVLSDPVEVELPAAATFYTRPFIKTESGSNTTLAANVTAGDLTISTVAKLGGNTTRGFIGVTVIEAGGGTREAVEIVDWSGSGPYTATLKAAAAFAHTSGTVVGGTIFSNLSTRGDFGESNVVGVTDNSWTTAALAAPSTATFTLAAAANVNDTSIQITNIGAGCGPTVTLSGVTYTVRAVYGTANPYTIYLTTPITVAATNGATVTGSVATSIGVAPTVIVADTVIGNPPPAIIVIGDSIPNGVGQSTIYPATSYFTLAADAAGRPYIQTAKSGEAAYQYVDTATSRRRRTLLKLAGWLYLAYGVNDIYGARTLSQVQADITTIANLAKERGLKVAIATLTPRTTSTDNHMTTGNQTIAASGFNAVKVSFNTWVRAGAGGAADLVVDLAAATESSAGSGLWKADASGPYTVDGIHPSNVGAALMKSTMDTAIAAMV